MEDSSEQMRILDSIASGAITAEEGLRQLAALSEQEQADPEALEVAATPPLVPVEPPVAADLESGEILAAAAGWTARPADPAPQADKAAQEPVRPEVLPEDRQEDFERWKHYWMIPLWIGVGITILGGILMYQALQSSGMGFWFFCATIPLIIGVILLVAGAQSRTAHWLHVRVQQAPGERPQRIAISFPIPIGLTAWFFRTFRNKIPGMENAPANLDEILYAMRDSTSSENPIYIRVDDDEDGEKVEIYIG